MELLNVARRHSYAMLYALRCRKDRSKENGECNQAEGNVDRLRAFCFFLRVLVPFEGNHVKAIVNKVNPTADVYVWPLAKCRSDQIGPDQTRPDWVGSD